MRKTKNLLVMLLLTTATACASKKPDVPYPAFMQSVEIPDSFLAELPGTRAKILATNISSRSYSMLLQIPPDYQFGTGGAPDKTLEIYVLEGRVSIGEFDLDPGGYAYLPSGTTGTSMQSVSGALLLYFIDDAHGDAVIQTPIIGDSDLVSWRPWSESVGDFGLSIKELRSDPGSGATTWLQKIDPGAVQSWQSGTARQEGYLIGGQYRHSECVDGISVPGDYGPGGYFRRPADMVNGGPEAAALSSSVWLMRVPEHASFSRNLDCGTEQGD